MIFTNREQILYAPYLFANYSTICCTYLYRIEIPDERTICVKKILQLHRDIIKLHNLNSI